MKPFGNCFGYGGLVQHWTNLNQNLPENFWKEEDTTNYFVEEETGLIFTIDIE